MDLNEAVKAIREECKKHERCDDCQLRDNNGYCYIQKTQPNLYRLLSEATETKDRIFC